MPKKKIEETETSTLNPNDLLVKAAFDGLREDAKDMLSDLITAGEGSYLKRLPTDDSGFGKSVKHAVYTAANRKSTKANTQPDHRTVASAVRRGFLQRIQDEKGQLVRFELNEGPSGAFRTSLAAVIAAA
jgi:hypothetical protein